MDELLRTYLCDQNETFETDNSQSRSFFGTFGKELGLFGVSFDSLVTKFKRRIATVGATVAFRFEEICYLTP